MNQHLVSLFSVIKDEKVFQFMCGAATFDEVQAVLDQFKADFEELKKQQEDELAKKALESQQQEQQEKPQEDAVEPEVVSGE